MAYTLENWGIDTPGRTSLWRYMSLSKLLQMLQSRTIWLARVDTLLAEDPYEGSLPFTYFQLQSDQSDRDAAMEKKHSEAPGTRKQMRDMFLAMHQMERLRTYVSCWHAAITDNAAMWKLYGGGSDGSICVQTTTARMMKIVPDWVGIGKIKYTSYDKNWDVNVSNSYTPFFHKRSCFQHENEIRLLTNSSLDDIPFDVSNEATGLPVQFDPNELLLRIHVSPTSDSWFLDVVQKAVSSLGVDVPVEPAPMSILPVF